MVLVDTSIWIRALRKREPYAAHLDGPLRREERMDQAQTFGSAEVVALVRVRKLHGRGIGRIDLHPAGIGHDRRIAIVDRGFVSARAEELGIAYTPRVS